MKFFIGICLLALTVSSMGYRVARDTSDETQALWTEEQEMQAVQFMNQYCKNQSDVAAAVTKIHNGADKMVKCVLDIFQPKDVEEKVKSTIESVRDSKERIGNFFKEYCPKTDPAMQCITDFKPLLAYCLDDDEIEAVNLILGIARRLITFACHNHGERILQFIADDGIDCFEEERSDIRACISETTDKYDEKLKEVIFNPKDIEVKITKDDCDEYDKNTDCLVTLLKSKCEKRTVSEFVIDLFHEIKEETKCEFIQNAV